MASLVLLVVAAAWAAVLIPPLLRSRLENRPNSSVTDFRNQLSSLQRAMPTRGVSMRPMGRPLAPSPLSRPAASGRPALRSGVRTHGGAHVRSAGQEAAQRPDRPEVTRLHDAPRRARSHAEAPPRQAATGDAGGADVLKRRRANVLFVLVLTAACTVFLAVTTKSQPMAYLAGAAWLAVCVYVCVLSQARTARPAIAERRAAARPRDRRAPEQARGRPARSDAARTSRSHAHSRSEVHRSADRTRRPTDRWSAAL